MSAFEIVTDSCCDFTPEDYAGLNLHVVRLQINFQGQTREDRNDDTLHEFYDGLRKGDSAQTSAVNPEQWRAAIEPILRDGRDVLVMAFSSGLSTTYQSAEIAAAELREEYPQRNIRVVDTLCASLGQGLLVWYAAGKRDAGASLEEVYTWCQENKLHLCHFFTVDDLFFLKRGGRISSATALVGTMLQVKPVLHVDDEGHLVSISKSRGRKASIQALAQRAVELSANYPNETMFISHGDCPEDAWYLEELLRQKLNVKHVLIRYVGAVIGSHSGPGTLALFFLGDCR